MKKDLKYLILLIFTIAVVVLIEVNKPKPINWSPSYSRNDKIPFGNYVLYEMLPDIFPGQEIKTNYRTFYELRQNHKKEERFNYIFIGQSFSPSSEDLDSFSEFIENGNHAFIATESITEEISSNFNILFETYYPSQGDENKVLKIKDEVYFYEKGVGINQIIPGEGQEALAELSDGKPVAVRVPVGKGSIIFSSTPLAFTNYYMLQADNNKFVNQILAELPVKNIVWDEYYTSGRQKAGSELRYIFSSESLKWAYYLTIFGICIFMIFETKRKQRVIPIVRPPKNTSLEFAEIVGRLFYSKKNHKNLALKKMVYFLDFVRSKYNIKGSLLNNEFVEKLSEKSGLDKDELMKLKRDFSLIESSSELSDEGLLKLEKQLEKFKKQL